MSSIELTNTEIIEFYNANPNINVNDINLFFITIIRQLSTNLSSTMNDTNIGKIMQMVTDVSSKLDAMDCRISLKLIELKSEYIDSVKELLSNTSAKDEASLYHILERTQDTLLSKTSLLLNEFVPKTQEGYSAIETIITSHYSEIQKTTKDLLSSRDSSSSSDALIANIDGQFTKMIGLVQQPICTALQSSEERTQTNLRQMSTQLTEQETASKGLAAEMTTFLDKYKNNSSTKGNVSESELYSLLQTIMPTDEIIRCSSDTAACDIRVNRQDETKPTILFENKNYGRSVDTDEIKKFERDICIQKQHGIFLSQTSPIVFKDTFHIDIINGYILVYIPNANYDGSKIRVAINIIDHLAAQLLEIQRLMPDEDSSGKKSMSPSVLNKIIKEYVEFGMKKMEMCEIVKTMSKQMTDKLDEMQLPSLNSFLLGTGQYKNDKFGCSLCNFTGKNKSSLSAHMRNCKKINTPPPVSSPKTSPIAEKMIE
jgi:hypothetical protein